MEESLGESKKRRYDFPESEADRKYREKKREMQRQMQAANAEIKERELAIARTIALREAMNWPTAKLNDLAPGTLVFARFRQYPFWYVT